MSLGVQRHKAGRHPYRWICLGVVGATSLLVMITRYGPAVITQDLAREYQAGPVELGLIGAVGFWTYAAVQIPTGILADTLGSRRTVSVFLLLGAVGAFFFANASSFPVVIMGRAILGLGTGVALVCGLKVLSQWFRTNEFATATGLAVGAGNVGTLLAATPLALLVGAIGWHSSFTLIAALLAFLGLLVFALLRDRPPTVPCVDDSIEVEKTADAYPSLRTVWSLVLLNKHLWLLSLFGFNFVGAFLALQGLWFVPYYMDVYSANRQEAATILSVWAVALIVGCYISGKIADRGATNRTGVPLAGIIGLLLVFFILAAAVNSLPIWAFYPLFILGGVASSTTPVVYSLLNDTLPAEVVGTAMGVYNMWIIIGAAVYQQVTGLILAGYPNPIGMASSDGYRAMFVFCLVGLLIGIGAMVVIRHSIRASQTPVDAKLIG